MVSPREMLLRQQGVYNTDEDSVGILQETVVHVPITTVTSSDTMNTVIGVPAGSWKVVACGVSTLSSLAEHTENYVDFVVKSTTAAGASSNTQLATLSTSATAVAAKTTAAFTLDGDTTVVEGGALEILVTGAGTGAIVADTGVITAVLRRVDD